MNQKSLLALICGLCIALSGCSNTTVTNNTPSETSTEKTSTEETTTEETTTEAIPSIEDVTLEKERMYYEYIEQLIGEAKSHCKNPASFDVQEVIVWVCGNFETIEDFEKQTEDNKELLKDNHYNPLTIYISYTAENTLGIPIASKKQYKLDDRYSGLFGSTDIEASDYDEFYKIVHGRDSEFELVARNYYKDSSYSLDKYANVYFLLDIEDYKNQGYIIN